VRKSLLVADRSAGRTRATGSGDGYCLRFRMVRRSTEAMYEASGMTETVRDKLIYELWRKRVSYAKIAKRVGISVGAVRASLSRTGERMTGRR